MFKNPQTHLGEYLIIGTHVYFRDRAAATAIFALCFAVRRMNCVRKHANKVELVFTVDYFGVNSSFSSETFMQQLFPLF
jgi:hypothetical protein